MLRYSHRLIEIAQILRQRQTRAEKLLWKKLRRQQLYGLKFRRQHRLGKYVVDFYCAKLKLAVELEGTIHDTTKQKEYDTVRFQELEARGLKILRINNEEVINDLEKVLEKILQSWLTLSPVPSPESGEGWLRQRRRRGEGK